MDSKMKLSWEGLGVILANLGGLGESFFESFVLGRLEGILDGL